MCTSCGFQTPQFVKQKEPAGQTQTPNQSIQGTGGQSPYQGVQPPNQSVQGTAGQPPYQGVQPPNQSVQGTAGQPPYQGVQPPNQSAQGTAGQPPYQGIQSPYQNGPPYQGPPVQHQAYTPSPTIETPSAQSKRRMTIIFFVAMGIVLVSIVALLFLGMSIIRKSTNSSNISAGQDRLRQEDVMPENHEDKISGVDEGILTNNDADGEYSYIREEVTERNWQEEGQDPSYPYYSGPYNALRDDLSYKVSFTEELYFSKNDDLVFISVEYPQITGKLNNIDYINTIISLEFEFMVGIYESDLKPYMGEDDVCYIYVDSFVTYMDEKILSVVLYESVYCEQIQEPYSMINFYCLNFDLETGTLLNNIELLRIDDDFAVEFRHREVEENGDEILTYYTDQEILEMLQKDYLLVAYYTPMGMEIGLNLEHVIIYVTYADYEQYLTSF